MGRALAQSCVERTARRPHFPGMIKPLALAALLVPTAAAAQSVPVAPGLPGWQTLAFSGIPENRWGEAGGALTVESPAGSSLLYAPVSVDPRATPILRFRWRVDQGPPPTDLSRKGGDDRAVALGVGFRWLPSRAGFVAQMKRPLVEGKLGPDAPGRAIELAWGGTAPRGTSFASPYGGEDSQIVVLRDSGAPTGQWIEERVDLAALHRQLWGDEAPAIVQVAVLADGDDTGTTIRAQVADIRFTAD